MSSAANSHVIWPEGFNGWFSWSIQHRRSSWSGGISRCSRVSRGTASRRSNSSVPTVGHLPTLVPSPRCPRRSATEWHIRLDSLVAKQPRSSTIFGPLFIFFFTTPDRALRRTSWRSVAARSCALSACARSTGHCVRRRSALPPRRVDVAHAFLRVANTLDRWDSNGHVRYERCRSRKTDLQTSKDILNHSSREINATCRFLLQLNADMQNCEITRLSVGNTGVVIPIG